MIVNFFILYTIVSTYLIQDLFPRHPLAKQSSVVVSFTALSWWLINYTDTFQPFILESSVCISVGALYYILLLVVDSFSGISDWFKRTLIYVGLGIFLFFLYQPFHGYFYNTFLLDFATLRILIFGLIASIAVLFYKYLKLSVTPTVSKFIKLEWIFLFAYTAIHFHIFFMNVDYFTNVRFYFFYIMYFSFFIPHIVTSPITTIRLFSNSLIFSLLFLLLGTLYIFLFTVLEFPILQVPFQYFFYGLTPFLIVSFFYILDLCLKKLDQLYPFSVLNHSQFLFFTDVLKGISKRSDLKQLLINYSIFKSTSNRLHLWTVQENYRSVSLTEESPILDNEIIVFLQYKETVYFQDLNLLVMQYSQTPFQSNVRMISNFMRKFSIVKLSLLQKSRETVGVFAISFQGARLEILNFDTQQFQLLEDILSNTLCNTNSVLRLLNHQKILEHINIASSKFNISIDENAYYTIIRNTLINIIPEIKFYFLLKYDSDSQFYKRSFLLTKQHPNQAMKVHANVIDQALKDNMYTKFSLSHPNTPIEFQTVMKNVGVNHLFLIRLSESSGSSIFVLFFDSHIDILDYRISFCQMFLRQSDIFYQYQANCEELNRLQLFLRRLLDQLPTGILITSIDYELKYINSKMGEQLDQDLIHYTNKDLREIGVVNDIIEAIDHVVINDDDYSKKVVLPLNNKDELYLLSSFKILQDQEPSIIVVLTNIQQSKELVDQMNQTNRLAMMSKIAKGISYELSKPVDQLINGVEQIQYRWSDSHFQDYFTTDIIPQVDRINLLCQSLLRLSRSNTESLVEVFLPDLLDQVFRLIAGDLRYTTQKFYVGVLDRKWIIVDQVMAIQVLMNLMIFCLKSLANDDSRLSLDITVAANDLLNIKIGIKHYIDQRFSNENELKDQLELSIVNQIVMNQNGQFDIFCENELASFSIMLPIKKLTPSKNTSH